MLQATTEAAGTLCLTTDNGVMVIPMLDGRGEISVGTSPTVLRYWEQSRIAKDPGNINREPRPRCAYTSPKFACHFSDRRTLFFASLWDEGTTSTRSWSDQTIPKAECPPPADEERTTERSGLQHLYLLRRENIAQRDLYFGI